MSGKATEVSPAGGGRGHPGADHVLCHPGSRRDCSKVETDTPHTSRLLVGS